MEQRPDSDFDWIRDGCAKPVLKRDYHPWPGNTLSVLLPPGFEAYVKILHSISANYRRIDDPDPFTEKEIAILEIPACTELRSFVQTKREEGRGPRIRWKELANFLGVPFEAQICHAWFRKSMNEPSCWPRFLFGPDEGNLDHDELSELVSILQSFTGEQECFLRFAEIPFIATNKPLLFAGALGHVVDFGKEINYQFSPEYIWPSDKSWCACSDYDLGFTFVGGPQALISAILASKELEGFQVTYQTRIDYEAPMPERSPEVDGSW